MRRGHFASQPPLRRLVRRGPSWAGSRTAEPCSATTSCRMCADSGTHGGGHVSSEYGRARASTLSTRRWQVGRLAHGRTGRSRPCRAGPGDGRLGSSGAGRRGAPIRLLDRPPLPVGRASGRRPRRRAGRGGSRACGGRVLHAGAVADLGRVVTVLCGTRRVTYLPLATLTVRAGAAVFRGARIGTVAAGHG